MMLSSYWESRARKLEKAMAIIAGGRRGGREPISAARARKIAQHALAGIEATRSVALGSKSKEKEGKLT